MNVSRVGAAAALLAGGAGTSAAFSFASTRVTIDVPSIQAPLQIPPRLTSTSRQSDILRMNRRQEDSSETALQDDNTFLDTSRRDALHRCSSIVAAAFATAMHPPEARAAEFASSLDEAAAEREYELERNPPPMQETTSGPQLADERATITPVRPQASFAAPVPASAATEVPSPAPSPSKFSRASNTATPSPAPKGSSGFKLGPAFLPEAAVASTILYATTRAVTGRVEPNADELTAKCKVVMIQPEPYGLDTGRRWYNGVDVTINEPVPASDVRNFCDAGRVNNECTETITGFLGEVSQSQNGMEPSEGQKETATAVLSYLDSLASSKKSGGDGTETTVAFSSYLNGLSTGEIDAPGSPKMVAQYLDALNGQDQRLSTIESKVNALESSVDRLPSEISGRLEQWQADQDAKLAKEFLKIEGYLVNGEGGSGVLIRCRSAEKASWPFVEQTYLLLNSSGKSIVARNTLRRTVLLGILGLTY